MNAKEIVEKFKTILLSSTEVVETPSVETEVELKEETVAQDLAEAPVDAPAEDLPVDEAPVEEEKFATKEELTQAIAELKAMYDQIMESMSTEEPLDAPQELASEEEVKEELSSQEEIAPLTHTPEEVVSSRELNLFAQKRAKTTFDLVLSKISK